MKTATRPDDLEILGHLLQGGLQSQLSQIVPLQVRCQLKDGTLVVVAQHAADVKINPQQAFGYLKQTILTQAQPETQQVQMYLRIVGKKRPYAAQSFVLEPAESSQSSTLLEETLDPLRVAATDASSIESEPVQNSETPTLPHPWDQPIPESNENPAKADASKKIEVTPSQTPSDEQPSETPTAKKAKSQPSWLPLAVAGTGLSLAVFLGSLYVLTRPCVIGPCRAIPEAQQLYKESIQTLQKPISGKEVLEAQQQITEAIQILESIPLWSKHRSQAQEIIKAYQAQAKTVDEMVTALKTAARAAYKSENPPHSASKWIEIQGMWREAIAQLEQLPTKSNLQPLAKQKIKEYKLNLAQTRQRLVQERQAKEHIKAAKEAALIAEARQGVAQSLPHWQLVYGTWQTALKRLREIPQGTTSYDEAQDLIRLYTSKMAVSRDRKTQEQISNNAYNQGVRLAQLATNAQGINQWSVAVIHWRNALSYINQVPRDTYYYNKAQSLVTPYNNALKQAQGKLEVAVKIQQARRDLNQICLNKTLICSYTIDTSAIKVRLTPTYMQTVRQTASAAQAKGDAKTQQGIVNHILTLGQALEAISDNAQMRVEVYNPDGSLVESHTPGV